MVRIDEESLVTEATQGPCVLTDAWAYIKTLSLHAKRLSIQQLSDPCLSAPWRRESGQRDAVGPNSSHA